MATVVGILTPVDLRPLMTEKVKGMKVFVPNSEAD